MKIKSRSLLAPIEWMRRHPFQSAFTSILLGCLATTYAFRDDWWGVWIVGGVWIMVFALSMIRFERKQKTKIATMFLALSIAIPSNAHSAPEVPPPAEELGGDGGAADPQCGAGAVIGVVVICIGAYCVYRMVKFCQKKFPRADNAKKNDFTNLDESPDTDAAAFNFGEMGSCGPCDDDLTSLLSGTDPHLNFCLDLDVTIDYEAEVILTPHITTDRTPENLISFSEFAAEVATYGVKVTGTGSSEYYSHNGIPVTRESALIKFEKNLRMVKIGDGSYSVIIERSFDLLTWEPVLHTEVSDGARVRMVDTTRTGQAFYRYRGYRSD